MVWNLQPGGEVFKIWADLSLGNFFVCLNPPRVWNLGPLTTKNSTGGLKFDTPGGWRVQVCNLLGTHALNGIHVVSRSLFHALAVFFWLAHSGEWIDQDSNGAVRSCFCTMKQRVKPQQPHIATPGCLSFYLVVPKGKTLHFWTVSSVQYQYGYVFDHLWSSLITLYQEHHFRNPAPSIHNIFFVHSHSIRDSNHCPCSPNLRVKKSTGDDWGRSRSRSRSPTPSKRSSWSRLGSTIWVCVHWRKGRILCLTIRRFRSSSSSSSSRSCCCCCCCCCGGRQRFSSFRRFLPVYPLNSWKMLEKNICCSSVSSCFCSVNDIDDFCWCRILNEFVWFHVAAAFFLYMILVGFCCKLHLEIQSNQRFA